MIEVIADLHIHSCLSPCSELDMTPARIVRRAGEKGLSMIAVSDHNSALNVEAVLRAAHGTGITVLPAMEITSREEVHVLAYFEKLDDISKLQDDIQISLPNVSDSKTNWQVIVNEYDEVTGFSGKLLMGASSYGLTELTSRIKEGGGIAVASHVDRQSFSVYSQLGYLPADAGFDAYEAVDPVKAKKLISPDAVMIFSSDAHRIEDIGRRTTRFCMQVASFGEFRLAIEGIGQRAVLLQ